MASFHFDFRIVRFYSENKKNEMIPTLPQALP